MRAASPPRQMERENEMIVISHRLLAWPADAEGFKSADPIVIRSHSEIRLCTYTVFPATHAKFLLQGNKYTEEEYDMSSREESSTMENVQKDIPCLRKVFS